MKEEKEQNAFQKIFTLPKNSLILVFGIWFIFGIFAYVDIVFPILFAPPKFLEYNPVLKEYEKVSIVYACANKEKVVIDSKSLQNIATEHNLYCENRYIADTMTGMSLIGGIVALIFKVFVSFQKEIKLKIIKTFSLIWAFSLLSLFVSESLFTVGAVLGLGNFYYSLYMSEIIDYNLIYAPNGFSKALNASCFVLYGAGSIVSLTIAYLLGSNWKVYYGLNAIYLIIGVFLLSIGKYEQISESDSELLSGYEKADSSLELKLRKQSSSDSLKVSTQPAITKVAVTNVNPQNTILPMSTYFINFLILGSGNIMFNMLIVLVGIELGDSSDPLYVFLALSMLLESYGSIRGSVFVLKYDQITGIKKSFLIMGFLCAPFLLYSEWNQNIFKYLALLAVFSANIAVIAVHTSLPDFFPKALYTRIFAGCSLIMRVVLLFSPLMFSYAKFQLHTHLIGILGVLVLIYTRFLGFLVLDPSSVEPEKVKARKDRFSRISHRASFYSSHLDSTSE